MHTKNINQGYKWGTLLLTCPRDIQTCLPVTYYKENIYKL